MEQHQQKQARKTAPKASAQQKLPAVIAALSMTVLMGLGIVAVGGNAILSAQSTAAGTEVAQAPAAAAQPNSAATLAKPASTATAVQATKTTTQAATAVTAKPAATPTPLAQAVNQNAKRPVLRTGGS